MNHEPGWTAPALDEAQTEWSKQLRSGAFGDLMKQEEDDWRPDIDELVAEKESKDERPDY